RHLHWETGESLAPAIIEKLIARPFPAKTLVNVNFPNCAPQDVQGVRITSQGAFTHGLFMEMRRDGRGFPYYWLRFGREESEQKESADIVAIRENHVSVTPLKLDLTHEEFADELRTLF
ncbi:MAG: 5'/3'-nucleotidase SurE, partial [Pseudomonadota bacterium]|nr:5'/3'-nucleotidase SurE [Pseudomonadota bacterium]